MWFLPFDRAAISRAYSASIDTESSILKPLSITITMLELERSTKYVGFCVEYYESGCYLGLSNPKLFRFLTLYPYLNSYFCIFGYFLTFFWTWILGENARFASSFMFTLLTFFGFFFAVLIFISFMVVILLEDSSLGLGEKILLKFLGVLWPLIVEELIVSVFLF